MSSNGPELRRPQTSGAMSSFLLQIEPPNVKGVSTWLSRWRSFAGAAIRRGNSFPTVSARACCGLLTEADPAADASTADPGRHYPLQPQPRAAARRPRSVARAIWLYPTINGPAATPDRPVGGRRTPQRVDEAHRRQVLQQPSRLVAPGSRRERSIGEVTWTWPHYRRVCPTH